MIITLGYEDLQCTMMVYNIMMLDQILRHRIVFEIDDVP